uniref:Guanylate-binding protein/Atlastin C-terminal domain-containing protein n=1 Tax=Polytomella parva TaxID=51329 RepID=A0A7S0UXM7_9CHLO|mmetsp:Transcript_21853/g.38998  ORF Transcript_21853/g.38998 Transcript_21853/m.38998 type:complete len:668 (+) Transcript_21853:1204-3207(+)|eukprot:CAMPEP_0175043952 /NCGR_PEP_ID=MMETSP0052_2-20121109/3507_1 /TAXON_ID=51329 ORGANISM="Polytomella parva, Strain SAG 63-3" /NCGR_SAMPLE_ID=MMETSP0052_2 /ASSEMBLY_ACC=CAM_ASM_000194 /LENGTH=667 /DNA_ID=CAMNT_0016307137 /DNA_START=1118 /DNA_END=3121 /DNA_ORIENTATION=-
MRQAIKKTFSHRICRTLVRPVLEESRLAAVNNLPYTELRSEFREGLESLMDTVMDLASDPKRIQGHVMTGSVLAALAQAFIHVINSGHTPEIRSTWHGVVQSECQRAQNLALSTYHSVFLRLSRGDKRSSHQSSAGENSSTRLLSNPSKALHAKANVNETAADHSHLEDDVLLWPEEIGKSGGEREGGESERMAESSVLLDFASIEDLDTSHAKALEEARRVFDNNSVGDEDDKKPFWNHVISSVEMPYKLLRSTWVARADERVTALLTEGSHLLAGVSLDLESDSNRLLSFLYRFHSTPGGPSKHSRFSNWISTTLVPALFSLAMRERSLVTAAAATTAAAKLELEEANNRWRLELATNAEEAAKQLKETERKLASEFDETIAKVEIQLSEKTSQLISSEEKLRNLEDALRKERADRNIAESNAAREASAVVKIQNDSNSKDAQLKKLESQVNDLTIEIAKLRDLHARHSFEKQEAASALSAAAVEVTRLSEEIVAERRDRAVRRQQNDDLIRQLENARKEVEALKGRAKAAEERVLEIQLELEETHRRGLKRGRESDDERQERRSKRAEARDSPVTGPLDLKEDPTPSSPTTNHQPPRMANDPQTTRQDPGQTFELPSDIGSMTTQQLKLWLTEHGMELTVFELNKNRRVTKQDFLDQVLKACGK